MDKNVIETYFINGKGKPSVLVVDFQTNSLTGHVFRRLNDILDNILSTQSLLWSSDKGNKIDGVIFTSTKKKIFLAGADLYQLNDMLDVPALLKEVINIGHETFNKIENLEIPTVAAINGICLGGGFELALACDYRICSNSKDVKIGLPEVNLGILPAWGGTTRLPRLVDLPTAVKVILNGSQLPGKLAKKYGMVDLVVHPEHLQSTGADIIRGVKTIRKRKFNPMSLIPHSVVLSKARKSVLSKTKGNYPAPEKIIEVLGTSCSKRESFDLERESFLELCNTKEMRNLLRIFFLGEQSKKLKISDSKEISKVKRVAVLGAGTMGAGIAQWVSSRGVNVMLKDVSDEALSPGMKKIGSLYVQGVKKHKIDRPDARTGLFKVTPTTDITKLDTCDIVIEAIIEKLDIKQKVLSELEDKLPDDAIIATNTSALSIDKMAESLKHPERFVGIHFFNPVHQMKLVEVVKGSQTSDATVARAVRFVQQIGKLPVVVKDSPGFVVNRILIPYLLKAATLLKEGHQIEAIDTSVVKFGMPMGPFRLMDEIGLDVCYHVANDLINRLNLDDSGVSELVSRIGAGDLGKKSGKGFYRYKKGKSIKNKFRKSFDCRVLVNTMVEEANKCIEEDIIDNSDMLDFAMIMGTGWAPFRGGPLNYKKSLK